MCDKKIECNSASCDICLTKTSTFEVLTKQNKLGELLALGEKSKRTLCFLLSKAETECKTDDIINYAWEDYPIKHSGLPVVIHKIRSVLETTNLKIITLRNRGYTLVIED